ncbi:hypothetical protein OGATHE_001224 [Ogataea polymorpha]|uniref:Uncharacterized protein n=1 Tax=Ogataea polymorpha TaxID=460523 RepID=A0A9P8PSP2_9ASCO|nr:hypothetical protein OGATHE_001224 [Ogataea polymorpha]
MKISICEEVHLDLCDDPVVEVGGEAVVVELFRGQGAQRVGRLFSRKQRVCQMDEHQGIYNSVRGELVELELHECRVVQVFKKPVAIESQKQMDTDVRQLSSRTDTMSVCMFSSEGSKLSWFSTAGGKSDVSGCTWATNASGDVLIVVIGLEDMLSSYESKIAEEGSGSVDSLSTRRTSFTSEEMDARLVRRDISAKSCVCGWERVEGGVSEALGAREHGSFRARHRRQLTEEPDFRHRVFFLWHKSHALEVLV